ncbi:hypothetical protein [Streptomyces tubercidicus]
MPRFRTRAAAMVAALTLLAFGATGCSDSNDDCDWVQVTLPGESV